jgi:hypothetical protein
MSMETFKQYIEEEHAPVYVVVRNNRVELRRMGVGSPVAAFAQGAVYAVLTGDHIQVNLKNGKTIFYKLSASGMGVSGPYIK